MTTLTDRTALFIDGLWRAPDTSEIIRAVSPFTEQQIGSFPASVSTDVDAAVSAARKALRRNDWADLSAAERARVIRRFADELEKRSEDRASAVTHQNGMPIELARFAEGPHPSSFCAITQASPSRCLPKSDGPANRCRVRQSCDASRSVSLLPSRPGTSRLCFRCSRSPRLLLRDAPSC